MLQKHILILSRITIKAEVVLHVTGVIRRTSLVRLGIIMMYLHLAVGCDAKKERARVQLDRGDLKYNNSPPPSPHPMTTP
jgi:hypothetical protein